MTTTPEMHAQIQIWRQQAREGTMTQEDFMKAFSHLRQDRARAADVSAASKARKSTATAKKNVNSDDLLSELDGI